MPPRFPQSSLIADLPDDALAAMSELATLCQYGPSDILFRRGERADGLYMVRNGQVALEYGDEEEARYVVDVAGAGQVLGWSWLFPPYQWQFDARATKRTQIIRIDGNGLRERCDHDSSVGLELYKRFSYIILDRLHAARRQLAGVRGPAHKRRRVFAEGGNTNSRA